jgi:DNA-binding NtrC family response regulator
MPSRKDAIAQLETISASGEEELVEMETNLRKMSESLEATRSSKTPLQIKLEEEKLQRKYQELQRREQEIQQALTAQQSSEDKSHPCPLNLSLPLKEAREAFERRYLTELLVNTQGSVSETARLAGLERTHLYRKLKNYFFNGFKRYSNPLSLISYIVASKTPILPAGNPLE